MAKKLISYDDEAEGLGLPDVVEEGLNATYGRYVDGLVADDSTDNRAKIQAALDEGGTIMLRPTTGRYAISGALNMTVPGTELLFYGAPVRQTSAPAPIVKAIAPDCTVDGLDATGVDGEPSFAGMTASVEGTLSASQWCAINVYSTAHRLKVPWVRGRGMSSVLRVAGWDAASNAESTQPVQDVEVGTVLCDRVEFGVALKGTHRIKIGSVRGTYGNTTTAPRPPHLLYFADGGGGHTQPTVGDATATDGKNGHAFQFKGITGGVLGSLQANGCDGVLNIMDCRNLDFAGPVISENDQFSGAQGGSVIVDTAATSDIHFGRISLKMAVEKCAYHVIDGTGVVVDDLYVQANHSTTGESADHDVIVAGSNNHVRRLVVENVGTSAWKAACIWGVGTGNSINAERLDNVRIGIDARTSPDAQIFYDLDRITLHPTAGLYPLGRLTTGSAKFLAPATAPLRLGALAADTFDVATASYSEIRGLITGHTWETLAGAWRRSANGKAYENTAVVRAAVVTNVGAADVLVEADILFQASEGIIVRALDNTTYLAVRLDTTSVVLYKRVGGAETTLATVDRPHQVGRTYRVGVLCFGANVDIIIDGATVHSQTLEEGDMTTFGALTKHGLRSSGSSTARFDNFRIAAA